MTTAPSVTATSSVTMASTLKFASSLALLKKDSSSYSNIDRGDSGSNIISDSNLVTVTWSQ